MTRTRGLKDADGQLLRERWSDPYVFFETKRLGITQSMRWTQEDGNTHVVAFDLLLGDVFALVSEIEVSEGGDTFLCTSEGEVFVPYRAREPGDEAVGPQHVFVPAAETGNAWIASAVAAWLGVAVPSTGRHSSS